MKALRAAVLVGVTALVGCTRASRSPDAIRNDTANVTAGAARDAKAVALGVVDGLRRKGPVNINKASSEDLQRLPGITPGIAETIIANRPFDSGSELVRRRIVSKSEYGQIADKIVAR